jgi:hypothetical protein
MAGIFDRKSFYEGDKYSAEAGKPKLNGGQVCFKFVLFALNILFLIFACVLIGVGSYALNNQVGAIAGSTIPTGLIVLGVFILILALLGAFSAWRESRALLGIYFLFLLIFTIILFAVGIAVYVEKDNAGDLITTAWMDSGPDVQMSLQNAYTCCGLAAWNVSSPGNCPPAANMPGGPACLPLMVDTFNSAFKTAGACGIAFSVIMLGGLIFICYLMTGIKRKREEQDIQKLRSGGDQIVMDVGYDAEPQEEPVETEEQ